MNFVAAAVAIVSFFDPPPQADASVESRDQPRPAVETPGFQDGDGAAAGEAEKARDVPPVAETIMAGLRPVVLTTVLTVGGEGRADGGDDDGNVAGDSAGAGSESAPPGGGGGLPVAVGGEGVVLVCRVANRGGQPVTVIISTITLTHIELSVTGPDGKPAPLTGHGRRSVEQARSGLGSRIISGIGPGGTSDEVVHLSRLYDLSRPGVYAASFSKSASVDGKRAKLDSTPVSFTVPN